jgi:two-component system, NarL family, response regulator NreC
VTVRGRVWVVESDRESARRIEGLLVEFGFSVCLATEASEDALRLAQRWAPDVVLMGLQRVGAHDAVRAAHRLQRELALRVVYLTDGCDVATLEHANTALPHAYLLKPIRPDDLRCCVELALHKRRLATLAGGSSAGSRSLAVTHRLRELSARELQVLRLVGLGHTSKDIAQRLQIAKPTVDTYRQRLAEKLGIKGRTGLMGLAAEVGLLAASTPQAPRGGD